MGPENSIAIYSIIAGVLVCSIFPFLIFSNAFFILPLELIADFGINGSTIFWGIIFPSFIVFIFWKSGKNISSSITQTTKYEACSQFTFEVSSKIIIALFTIYIIGSLLNGTSVALHSQFYYEILFSLIMILSVSVTLIVLTIFSSIIIVKQSLKSQY
ncbi:hypothetical protein SGQ44_16630 [Flavobacterium sp. Fl-77]|uniref:Uncharacterized protein n=1 Tax=Flavobacterium flavipigmentatum TaxID=2893884 RepID=A0AAJ2SJM3_9FLAO|nr:MULTISPECIES: hypothetical protein [unclassified Flavobacterium]MDX6183866.1 hypothetical protein [Flavobacterium sp. Fl-33]MDX6187389.1 hypothetical protein [Flavobacterium sp. Fl-77]UFH40293.1 hypothetical protein LNP22_08445 [Flavobacterium sp. F-70]